jgi:cell division protein FtsZ
MIEGLINMDFADVRAVMNEAGLALMGTGAASGENRAREAAERAITSPLLEDVSIDGAKAVLYNITVNRATDITNDELQEIGMLVTNAADPGAKIIMGVVYDDNAGDEMRITVIATGIEAAPKPEAVQAHANVTHFPGKQSPAREPAQQAQMHVTPAVGGARQGRIPALWYDEKSDVPAIVRQGQAREQKGHARHAPGEEDFLIDVEEFGLPAFIRRQAD